MNLLLVVACLFLDRQFDEFKQHRQLAWYQRAMQKSADWFGQRWFQGDYALVVLVLIPLYLFSIPLDLLSFFTFGLSDWLVSLGVLFLCLRPVDLLAVVKKYHLARQRDDRREYAASAKRLGITSNSDSVMALDRQVTDQLFIQACTGLVGLFFWFLLLGPLGAIGYRILAFIIDDRQITTSQSRQQAEFVMGWLLWLPTRLLCAAYALVGDRAAFRCMQAQREQSIPVYDFNQQLLRETGQVAMGQAVEVNAARTLVMKALVACLVGSALLDSVFALF